MSDFASVFIPFIQLVYAMIFMILVTLVIDKVDQFRKRNHNHEDAMHNTNNCVMIFEPFSDDDNDEDDEN